MKDNLTFYETINVPYFSRCYIYYPVIIQHNTVLYWVFRRPFSGFLLYTSWILSDILLKYPRYGYLRWFSVNAFITRFALIFSGI
jgi:hypothetical protein